MDPNRKLGRAFTLCRESTGKTQDELSELSGLSRSTIHRIESGNLGKLSGIIAYAEALGVTGIHDVLASMLEKKNEQA